MPPPQKNASTSSTASHLKGTTTSVIQGAQATAINALGDNRYYAALGVIFGKEPAEDEEARTEDNDNPKTKPKPSPCRKQSKRKKTNKAPSEMPAKVPKASQGVDLAAIATNLQDDERYVNDVEMTKSQALEDQFNEL